MKNFYRSIRFFFLLTLSFLNSYFALKAYDELPLAVIIPSYNNAKWYKRTLDSVFSQKYENFRLVYIDDCSPDGTGDLVEQYIKKHSLEHKCTLIKNKERCRKLKNIYNAIHSCDDREIVVQIDGDDWLAHDHVFADINKVYQTSDIWLTYGQYRNVPKEEAIKWGKTHSGFSEPVPQSVIHNCQFRKYKWFYNQLRTFYAWLFKLIKLEDLLSKNLLEYVGKFYPTSNDCAMMYSMLEMAHYRFEFIPDIAYIRNLYSPIVTFKVEKEMQIILGQEIKAKSKYGVVKEPIVGRIDALHDAKADLVVLSDQPTQLSNLLASVDHHVSGIGQVHVIYAANNIDTINIYKEIEKNFPNAHYIELSDNTLNNNIRSCIYNCIASSNSNYIVLAKDTIIINDHINLNKCITFLEQTFAYAFYLGLSRYEEPFYNDSYHEDSTPCQHIIEDIYAWKFCCNSKTWDFFNNPLYKDMNQARYSFNNLAINRTHIEMSLYRKKDVLKILENLYYNSLATFEDSWNKTTVDPNKVGLFFEQSNIEKYSIN